jgi:hypothetical protein
MLIPVVIVALVAILAVVVIVMRQRKSQQLKQRFGSEYDRTVHQIGDPRRAEAALSERERRVEKFVIRPLAPADRDMYSANWLKVQQRFVDEPAAAVTDADKLITTVMTARGYPMGDFEQRAADISVNYPQVVQNYRSARSIAVRHGEGQSSTEDLRQAMVYYRSLFEELLETPKTNDIGVPHERAS